MCDAQILSILFFFFSSLFITEADTRKQGSAQRGYIKGTKKLTGRGQTQNDLSTKNNHKCNKL